MQPFFNRLGSRYTSFPPVPIDPLPAFQKQLESSGPSWQYLYYDSLTKESITGIRNAALTTDTLIVCISELDHAGHLMGPWTDAFGEVLLKFSNTLKQLLDEILRKWPDVSIILFSDHGMTTVSGSFDIWKYLENKGFYLGREYIAFINSTVLSLWFDYGHREEIVAVLNRSGYGHVLTPDECVQYHLRFRDRRYGDAFFLASEGVELVPNFISIARGQGRGMHGYAPICSSTRAFFIGKTQGLRRPTDISGLHTILLEALRAGSRTTQEPGNRDDHGR